MLVEEREERSVFWAMVCYSYCCYYYCCYRRWCCCRGYSQKPSFWLMSWPNQLCCAHLSLMKPSNRINWRRKEVNCGMVGTWKVRNWRQTAQKTRRRRKVAAEAGKRLLPFSEIIGEYAVTLQLNLSQPRHLVRDVWLRRQIHRNRNDLHKLRVKSE